MAWPPKLTPWSERLIPIDSGRFHEPGLQPIRQLSAAASVCGPWKETAGASYVNSSIFVPRWESTVSEVRYELPEYCNELRHVTVVAVDHEHVEHWNSSRCALTV